MVLMISTPKTPAGTRTVPMFEDVRNVLLLLKSTQSDTSPNNIQYFGTSQEYSNFVLTNRHGTILLPMNINKTIKRIYTAANAYEEKLAKHENRLPVRIRHFTVHNFRHTFCTRLCEVENNIKLIMSIIGHSNVQTTMNIYNEIQESKKKSAFAELEEKMKIL